jgi:hypothetical protein
LDPGYQMAQSGIFEIFHIFINMENHTNHFKERSGLIHKNKYNYSLVEFINTRTKVTIICPIHGLFEQTPKNHLKGCGCQKCSSYLKSGTNLNKSDFKNKSNIVHKNKYNYSLVEFINTRTKVTIICPIHGLFEQRPSHHLKGHGCQKCSNNFKSFDEFLEKSNQIHDSKYDYSSVTYVDTHSKVKIICPVHGIFEQRPLHHYNGSGCPKCKNSKGETSILNFLKKEKIVFIPQKRFNDCKFIYPLPFDFFLPELNICIEYDGEQHFKPLLIFGGKIEYDKLQIRDKIKNEYCKSKKITLIRIKYNEDKINTLKNKLIMKT